MIVRVQIDKERCIGCGLCEENLPSIFEIGDFTARVRVPTTESTEELLATVADCPTEAISLSQVIEDGAEQS